VLAVVLGLLPEDTAVLVVDSTGATLVVVEGVTGVVCEVVLTEAPGPEYDNVKNARIRSTTKNANAATGSQFPFFLGPKGVPVAKIKSVLFSEAS
jgi:hypothetical protein